MTSLIATLRITAATLLICVAGYTCLILAFAQAVMPVSANGNLIRDREGRVIGSGQIAQRFSTDRYFWPRPSAVDYDAAGAGGSNKSPTSSDLAARGAALVGRYDATPQKPLPSDLAAASGAGLDPHISLAGARYQASRVAAARGMPVATLMRTIDRQAFAPGGPLTHDLIVNVLELNLALDAMGSR